MLTTRNRCKLNMVLCGIFWNCYSPQCCWKWWLFTSTLVNNFMLLSFELIFSSHFVWQSLVLLLNQWSGPTDLISLAIFLLVELSVEFVVVIVKSEQTCLFKGHVVTTVLSQLMGHMFTFIEALLSYHGASSMPSQTFENG